MFYRIKVNLLIVFAVLMSALEISAEIKMPRIFQSNMVLQRDKAVTIWGFANAGEKVGIDFNNGHFNCVAGKNGKWMIKLPPQIAGGPFEITLRGKSNTIVLRNILFGDVWICGGQSNMQITLDQIGYKPAAAANTNNKNIRLFTSSVDMDYVAKDDLAGGIWKEASAENIKYFSAVAYFFGQYLQDSLAVPIGLVSDNLGATSIETWMSPNALKQFPQFKDYHAMYLAPAKSFKEITAEFEKMKPAWESEYYLKGKGFEQKWYLPGTDISDWKTTEVPGWWEEKGEADFDGAVWYRKTFDMPEGFKGDTFNLQLNQIDDYDIAWINGDKVGEGFGNVNWRNYKVPSHILKPKDNVLVVRVFDTGGRGGMYTGPIWGNPVLLGSWKYKPDLKIDAASFPKPLVVNASPFSSPAVLFNGNIAPITNLAIKGIIWYQGESNAGRAEEYRQLFPAFINDWRAAFNQGDLPFIFVQLANYMQEAGEPGESEWAELREAQAMALKLPNTGVAVAIDIGEANDIHPKNKSGVGKRLALSALKIAYNKDVVFSGPAFQSIVINGDSAVISFSKAGGELITKDKYGYVRGFAIAGADKKFYWAKACINDNKVIVWGTGVRKPVAVRYAWSDNPGSLDLYNNMGMPAIPFRTDNWPTETRGKVFSENPWE
ncbi:MAG: sialate O-acetylesterase [Ferruginibacter sp.]